MKIDNYKQLVAPNMGMTKIDNFKEIVEATKAIETGIAQVIKNLDDLLASPRYIFEIKYNKKEYTLIPSTTIEEKAETDALRNEFIGKLVKNTINRNIKDNTYGWNDLLTFCTGLDSRDYEIEKITEVSYTPEVDANGEKITSKKLDFNNIALINQRTDITEEERIHLITEILLKDGELNAEEIAQMDKRAADFADFWIS
jgi:hypothetical protein